jgi:type II secretory pathway predicted ATPase ExeA
MFSHLTQLGRAFANTAGPQSLFLSHTHAGALEVLSDVTEEGHNIRVLIGETGVGKTTLLVRFLNDHKNSALTAHLFWTQLAGDQFLNYFLHELGVLDPFENTGHARKLFSEMLEREFGRRRKVIVAIDEAHNLELPTLHGLAEVLASSLARSNDLKIVFAGLPHLATKLASVESRGIWDRISGITSLTALTFDETALYINHRLRVLGLRGPAPFTPDALASIATLAEGVPGTISNLCCAAIHLAEQRACSVIDSDMILEAAAQRERRVIGQEIAPESIASPPNDAMHHEQTSVPTQHVAIPTATANTPFLTETAANIRERFGEDQLACSGTVGAAVSNRAGPELVYAVQMAMSFYEAVGRTPPVSLCRLQGGNRPSLKSPTAKQDCLSRKELTPVPAPLIVAIVKMR